MTSHSRRRFPLPNGHRRLVSRLEDVDLVERASVLIGELGVELDRRLAKERRPSERMRMLRATTMRITRAANDAVHAYSRASRGIRAELERPDADVAGAKKIRTRLDAARKKVLVALERANGRYAADATPLPAPDPPVQDDRASG